MLYASMAFGSGEQTSVDPWKEGIEHDGTGEEGIIQMNNTFFSSMFHQTPSERFL